MKKNIVFIISAVVAVMLTIFGFYQGAVVGFSIYDILAAFVFSVGAACRFSTTNERVLAGC